MEWESPAFSPAIDRALTIAALAHDQKTRKGTAVPYIMHPVHVAMILQRYGFDEAVVVAGLLHDVIEDMPFGDTMLQARLASTFPHAALGSGHSHVDYRNRFLRFVETEFGSDVLALVLRVTEPKNDGGPRRSWRERREYQLASLREADRRVAGLKAADLLHNLRTIIHDLERFGPDVMNRFNARPADSLWYYEAAVDLVADRLGAEGGFPAELRAALGRLQELLGRHGLTPSA